MSKILNKTISFYGKIVDKTTKEIDLYAILTSDKFKDQVAKVRQIKATGDTAAYNKAKQALPCFTVSGTFSGASDSSLLQHSGLICIDIDHKDNLDVDNFDNLKEIIHQVKHVAYCGHSVSGEGYFMVIPISHPDKHREHFRSLEKAFARCGLRIDPSGINVARKRFVSYDPEPYINVKAEVYSRAILNPKSEHQTEKKREQTDPRRKGGIVGAFCRAYDVHEAIETFLPHVYAMGEKANRYTYVTGTSSNGLIVYDDGRFACSHHGTDPICGKTCNAFDLVRLHLFGALDANCKTDTPINKLPSQKAMEELAMRDARVRQEQESEKNQSIETDFKNVTA